MADGTMGDSLPELEQFHPVARKLSSLLHYCVSVRRLRRKPFYIGYTVFSYARDVSAVIVGMGVTFPLFRVISGAQDRTTAALLAGLPVPFWLKVVAAIPVLGWAIVEVVVSREQWEKRATLAKSCVRQFAMLENRMVRVVKDEAEPMPGLIEIQKEMLAQIDRATQEGAFPVSTLDDVSLDAQVAGKLTYLIKHYGHGWSSPSTQQRSGRS